MRVSIPTVLLFAMAAGQSVAQEARMSDADYIRRAEEGGPRALTGEASIVRLAADGSTTVVRQGSNDLTCFAGIPGDPHNAETPLCADPNALQFMTDLVRGEPRPTNPAPGMAYMARGGFHLETPDGEIAMGEGPSTRRVKEPAHWMLMWPIDPTISGVATRENPAGVYVMFAGTPWAHLMVYQDPNKMFRGTSRSTSGAAGY